MVIWIHSQAITINTWLSYLESLYSENQGLCGSQKITATKKIITGGVTVLQEFKPEFVRKEGGGGWWEGE